MDAVRTYGTVRLSHDRKNWVIECEPHASLRMKRMFHGISTVGRTLYFSDTIDNAHDLEWFMDRYPMVCDKLEYLRDRSGQYRERQTTLAKLLAGVSERMHIPLAVPAREYQEQAAQIVRTTGRLLLADDVGLGKTISAIAAIVDPALLPAAVVTLTHLPRQWQAFIKRFAPHLESRIIKKGRPYDLRDRYGLMPDVIILNYHKLDGWADTLAGFVRSVIWDEAQELRHHKSLKWIAARRLADEVPYKMGLTATPIYNYGGECFNVIECIAPESLGTRSEFLAEWGEIIHEPRAFGSHLRDEGLMLRRTREEVGRELPGCQTFPETVECDLFALDDIRASCDELARRLLRKEENYRGEKMMAAAEFDMKLRQATGIGKAPHVAAFVELLIENGEKVVLYGWHRACYDIWLKRLDKYEPVLYTGTESPKQKDESKRQFVEGDSKVLLISLRAGAGLDGLQDVCSTVVFGELDWSPGVHEQCIGRVYRDGQKKPVFAYYLLAEEGSDPVVADILGLKQGQIEGLLRPEADIVTKSQIDPDHIKKLAAAYLHRRGLPPILKEQASPSTQAFAFNGEA